MTKRNLSSRITSLLLVVVMALTTLPTTAFAATGDSQGNAVSIAMDTRKTGTITAGGEYWYTFECDHVGTYHFVTTGSTNVVMTLYKKTLLGGLSEVEETGTTATNVNAYIDLDYNKTYYAKFTGKTSTTSGTFYLTIKTEDTYVSSGGGSWTATGGSHSGYYDSYKKIVYLTKDEAAALYYSKLNGITDTMIRDAVASTAFTAAAAATITKLAAIGSWTGNVGVSLLVAFPFLLKTGLDQYTLNEIRTAGGINDDGSFSNGIAITYIETTGGIYGRQVTCSYSAWDGLYLRSAPYSEGAFSASDKTAYT